MTDKPKCIQVMLSMLPEERAVFQVAAQMSGLSMSAWLCEQGRLALPADMRETIPERPPAHRPRKEN